MSGQRGDVRTVYFNCAGGGLDQAQYSAPDGGFATAGFSDHGDGFGLADGKADTIHSMHMPDQAAQQALADGEVFLEIGDLDDGWRVAHVGTLAPTSECQQAAK